MVSKVEYNGKNDNNLPGECKLSNDVSTDKAKPSSI